jgi:hypothetical protein
MRIPRLSQRSLGGLALTVTFLAGVAAGTVATKVWSWPGMQATLRTGNMAAVLDKLNLSPAQRQSADSILEHSAPRTEGIMLELAGRLNGVADSVDAQLRAILTPQQQTRLEELRRKPVLLLKRRSKEGTEVVDTLHATTRGGRP